MKTDLTIVLLLAASLFMAAGCRPDREEKRARYVFYFIGDGMGANQVSGTEMYLAARLGVIGAERLNFSGFPVKASATTFSRYNAVTCSAAAGTAMACGVKTRNGSIGMDSLNREPLSSVAVRAHEAGMKVGIVTSVSIDHATPAAFYAHQPDRKMYYEIATDLPKTGFELYAGSGFLEPDPAQNGGDGRDIFGILQDSGYVVARGMQEIAACPAGQGKVVWMQEAGTDPSSLPYAIDRREGDLSLAGLTEEAIRFLDNREGFFLMVEGGKIDWACHSNDAATVFREVTDLAEAVDKALDFYFRHPDETLIIVTADHETGGLALGRGPYALNLKILESQRMSTGRMTSRIEEMLREGGKCRWEDFKVLLGQEMGFWTDIDLEPEEIEELKSVYRQSVCRDSSGYVRTLYEFNHPLAEKAVQILNRKALLGWCSRGHSASEVPVFAVGPGSILFKGRMDNTDIPKKIAEAAGY